MERLSSFTDEQQFPHSNEKDVSEDAVDTEDDCCSSEETTPSVDSFNEGNITTTTRTYSPPPQLLPLPRVSLTCGVATNDVFSRVHMRQRSKRARLFCAEWELLSSLLYHKKAELQTSRPMGCNCSECRVSLLVDNPSWFPRLRQSLIEFIFEKFAHLTNKLCDNVLFSAIAFYDAYVHMELRNGCNDEVQLGSKETLLACLLLASKLENVRHLSLKMCCDVGNVTVAARKNILEKETTLFVQLNDVLYRPSAWSFVRALLTDRSKESPGRDNVSCELRSMAYHLAVYILTLNTVDVKSLGWTPEELGTACAWIVVLLLRLPLTPVLQQLAALANTQQYCIICQQVMKRALQGCQHAENPINRHFATAGRHRVTEMLCLASRTAVGGVFLSL